MELCGERNVAISFLSEHGKFYARVQGPVSGNVLLRREQYRRADSDEKSAEIARAVVIAKIANCRTVLLRGARDRPEAPQSPELEAAAQRLARLLDGLRQPSPLDAVRGVEGDAARTYFGVFDHLITAQKEDFYFRERSRRPPLSKPWGSTRPWDTSIATVRAARAWPSTSWRNSVPSSLTAWRFP